MKINTDKLKETILEELSLEIDSDSRLQDVVAAKIIYCRILRDCGWTLHGIGETINRNHATIIHYMKRFEGEQSIKFDTEMIINYKKVKNSFNRYLNKNYLSLMTRSELEQTIEKLLKDEKHI